MWYFLTSQFSRRREGLVSGLFGLTVLSILKRNLYEFVQPRAEKTESQDLLLPSGTTRDAIREQSGNKGAPIASAAAVTVADVESFIHDYYEAWGGTDLDRIMSYYAENVVLQIPGVLLEGKDAVRDQFAVPFTTAFPGNRHIVKNMVFGANVVVVEFSFEAEHQGPFAGHAATGARVKLPGCGVYEYDFGKRQITAGRIYLDVKTLLQTITDSLLGDRQKAEEALRTNERNLSLITNVVPTFIHVLRTDGTVLYANQAVLDYHGCTLEDVRKEDYRHRFFHPEDVERLREERRQAFARPVAFENEQRVLGKDGKYRWFLIRYNPLLDAQEKIDRWYVAAFDIEDRKRAEDALARQACVRGDVSAAFSKPTHLGEILRGCTEAIVRHLDAAFARIWLLNKDESTLELQASAGMYTRLDGSYSRISIGDLKVGLIAREKKAHFTNDVLNDPRVHDKGWAQCNGMVAFAGYPLVVEDRLIGVLALFARRPLPESILNTLASVADTLAQGIERKRAEQAVREREREARLIVDSIPGPVALLNEDGELQFVNRQIVEYTGRSLDELKQWGTNDTVHPDDLPHVIEVFTRSIVSGSSYEIVQRLRRSDGAYHWFQNSGFPVRDSSGEILLWCVLLTDIDDRKRAEKALQQAYAFLAEAQRVSKTGSFITDLLADEHNWSEELCRIFELNPGTRVTTEVIRALFHPEDLPILADAFKRAVDGQDLDFTYRIITPTGNVKHLHSVAHLQQKIDGRPVYIGAIADVTESKAAEGALQNARAELERVSRVTTMGELAASIAHEINQPLAGIVTSANAGLNWLAANPPNLSKTRETLERIRRDGTRGGEVLARIRALLKRTPPAKSLVSVNQIVRDVLALTAGELRQDNIELSLQLASTLPEIRGDNIQLQQVLLNLIKNAIEAMSEIANGQRTLRIQSRLGELDIKPAVLVEVSDTGVGFSRSDSLRLFEAFHTTKSQGMGMGLWISRSIIENHHGRLTASSNDGRGATFVIMLPKASEEQA